MINNNAGRVMPKADGKVPARRFPEFKNASPWKEEFLGIITEITIGEFVIKTKQNPKAMYPVFNGGKSYTGFYDEFNNEGNKIRG